MQAVLVALLYRMSLQASSQSVHGRVKEECSKSRDDTNLKVMLVQQHYLQPPGQIPKELMTHRLTDLNESQKRALFDKGIKELSLFDKLGVLMGAKGFQRVCQVVREGAEQNYSNHEDKMAEYDEEVSRWTQGVLTCFQLNPLRTLRTLLFAELETCWRLEDQKAVLNVEGFPLNCKEGLEKFRDSLVESFALVEGALENPGKIVDVQQCLSAAIFFIEKYRGQMGKGSSELNLEQRRRAAEKMREILQLLQKGFSDPFYLLPLLFQPLKVQPACSETGLVTHVSSEALEWLYAFQRAFSFQVSSFPKVLREHLERSHRYAANRGIFLKAEAACKDLVAYSETFSLNIQKLVMSWRAYAGLSPEKQYQEREVLIRLKEESDRLRPSIMEFHQHNRSCRNEMQTAIDLLKGQPAPEEGVDHHTQLTLLYGSSIHHPVSYLSSLCAFSWSSIYNVLNLYEDSFKRFKELLVPPYSAMPHVTTIDLLHCQTDEALLNVLDKLKGGQISGTGDMADLIETMQTLKSDYNAIFNAMRRYYHQRRHRLARSREDFQLDVQCLQKLNEHRQRIKDLQQARQPKAVQDVLLGCEKLVNFLKPLLGYERWPEMLVSSPFANHNLKEEPFYAIQLANLRRSFLKIDPPNFHKGLQQFLHNKPIYADEEPLIEGLLKASAEVVEVMQGTQTIVKELKPEDARRFWNSMVQCQQGIAAALEKIQQKIERHCEKHVNHSSLLGQIQSEYLSRMANFLEGLIFTPGHSLVTYLHQRELIEEESQSEMLRAEALKRRREERKKSQSVHKVEEHTPIVPTVQTSSQPSQRPLELGVYPAFRQLCLIFADRCRSFLLKPSSSPETNQNHFRQNDYASNLLRNLQPLEELFSVSAQEKKRPMVVLETGERLALALEQATKLACAIRNLSETVPDNPDPVLENRGWECYWHAHAPLLLAGPIQKFAEKPLLSEEESAFLDSLACMAAITYRNPYSGNDRITEALTAGNETGSMLREGLKICLKILQQAEPQDFQRVEEATLDAGRLEKILAPCQSAFLDESGWQLKAENALLRVQNRLKLIQHLRTVELNRQVPSLGKRDQSQKKRMGTIDGALKDLELNLTICEDILFGPEAPTLALTLTEASLSRQGAMLAEALLALLAHLPCQERPGSTQHSLWTMKQKGRPLRYSHDLVEYVKLLPIELGEIFAPIHQMAAKLTPYLQQRHRYAAPNCELGLLRDKVADLSSLRRRILSGNLCPAERLSLGDAPEQQLANLDSHLRSILLNEVKAPLVHTLEAVEKLLIMYEKQIAK